MSSTQEQRDCQEKTIQHLEIFPPQDVTYNFKKGHQVSVASADRKDNRSGGGVGGGAFPLH